MKNFRTVGQFIFLFLIMSSFVYSDEKLEIQGTVTGKVYLPDGKPAVNAQVEFWSFDKSWTEPVRTGSTDEAGEFKISLPVGSYFYKAKEGNNGALEMSMEESLKVKKDGTVTESPSILLKPGCIVTGTLRDTETGNPIAGANIISDEGDKVLTDANGVYHISGMSPRNHSLAIIKNGYTMSGVNLDLTGRDSVDMDLECKPDGTIKGKVTNEKNEPVAGAEVADHRSGSVFIVGHQRVLTDKNGEYRIQGYDPDQPVWSIGVSVKGYSAISKSNIQFPSGSREVTVDFVLSSTVNVAKTNVSSEGSSVMKLRTISGMVTDRQGNPIKNAQVSYTFDESYVDYKSTHTKDDGTYQLESIPDEKEIIAVQAKGFAPSWHIMETNGNETINFTMETGHWVEGRVIDEEGKPIPNIYISPRISFSEGNRFYNSYLKQRVTTDSNGQFKLTDLPEKYITLEAYGAKYSRVDNVQIQMDQGNCTITMLPLGQVSGTVLDDESGLPIKKFKVFLDSPKVQQPGDKSGGFSAAYVSSGVTFNSPDGTFTVSELNTGNVLQVIIDAPGYYRNSIDRVIAEPISKIDYQKAIVRMNKSNKVFEGYVFDSVSKVAVSDVKVSVYDTQLRYFDWGNSYMTRQSLLATGKTDGDGKFHFEGLSAPQVYLALEKSGYPRMLSSKVDATKSQAILYPHSAVISGILKDKDGKPEQGVNVQVSANRGVGMSIFYGFVKTDDNGKFTFTDLPPGNFSITRLRGNMGIPVQTVKLTPGQTYSLDLGKLSENDIEGTVTYHGKPVSDVRVALQSMDTERYFFTDFTDAKGQYHVNIPHAGKYSLNFEQGSYQDFQNMNRLNKSYSANSGINHLDVSMPGAAVQGLLLDGKNKKAIPNCQIAAYFKMDESVNPSLGKNRWNQVKTTTTDNNGQFNFKDLQDGEWIFAYTLSTVALIPSQSFQIRKDETRDNIVVQTVETGSALINPIDATSGEIVAFLFMETMDKSGFPVLSGYQNLQSQLNYVPPSARIKAESNGMVLVPNLLPGKYKVYATSKTHLTDSTDFMIQAGRQTQVNLKLSKGGRIGFHLVGNNRDSMPETCTVNCKITKKGEVAPSPSGLNPSTPGVYFTLKKDSNYQDFSPLAPGEYTIDVKSGYLDKSDDGMAEYKEIWSGKQTIKIEQGKDQIVQITFNK